MVFYICSEANNGLRQRKKKILSSSQPHFLTKTSIVNRDNTFNPEIFT